MGEIIELDNARKSHRQPSQTRTSDCESNNADNASLDSATVQPGMVILFNMLQRGQAVRLPGGAVYRLHDSQLEAWRSECWQPAQIGVNELLSQVCGLSRSQWRQILESSDRIPHQDTPI
ncbi:MAG: hypothetical protein CMK32_01085 [Porticoccaceae bacterium]|nr:hypothetical protein [Porticoccaceae bacterium]